MTALTSVGNVRSHTEREQKSYLCVICYQCQLNLTTSVYVLAIMSWAVSKHMMYYRSGSVSWYLADLSDSEDL